MANYFLDNDLQVLKIALCSALTDSTKDEPMGVIRFWYWWSNNLKEIQKLSGVKPCGSLGALYNKNNKRIYNDSGYRPDYNYDDLMAASKAMDLLSPESTMIINQELIGGTINEKRHRLGIGRMTYYRKRVNAFDEFIERGGVRDLLYA